MVSSGGHCNAASSWLKGIGMISRDLALFMLSVPVSVLASLTAWLYITQQLVPDLQFSEHISRLPSPHLPCRVMYRWKVRNAGRRTAVDVEFVAELRLPGLRPGFPDNTEVFHIPLERDRVPCMQPADDGGLDEIIRLRLEDVSWSVSLARLVAPDLAQHLSAGEASLEELLALSPDASIRIVVFAYDQFSGVRNVFISQHYSLESIVERRFTRHSLQTTAP
jgi:hypothetical protein